MPKKYHKILVTTYPIPFTDKDETGIIGIRESYFSSLYKSGLEPVLVSPLTPKPLLEQLKKEASGLLIPGGNDIDPKSYGEKNYASVGTIKAKDDFELDLINWAYNKKTPTLGICRGCQLLNVSRGGTLYQNIASDIPKAILHGKGMAPGAYDAMRKNLHEVKITENTLVQNIYKKSKIKVNSEHRQSIKKLGKGLVVSMLSSADGVIEGVESKNKNQFFVGIQGHPEAGAPPFAKPLFTAFRDACKKYNKR